MPTWELLCNVFFFQWGVSLMLPRALPVLYAGGKEEAGFVVFLKGFMEGYMFWWGRRCLYPRREWPLLMLFLPWVQEQLLVNSV